MGSSREFKESSWPLIPRNTFTGTVIVIHHLKYMSGFAECFLESKDNTITALYRSHKYKLSPPD